MSDGALILALRCHWCSRQLSPRDLRHLSTGQRMCERCHENHVRALALLTGERLPEGCQECGVPLATLNILDDRPTVRMYIVSRDGLYQILCEHCTGIYVAQRPDLYHQPNH